MDTSGFFETFFNNAEYNGILVMDKEGTILNVNKAFHIRFGYEAKDLIGKNFSLLFTEKDKETNRPERELQNVLANGSANDENYLMHKEGNKVWVTGESVLIENDEDQIYIVKVVHNIHAQKQLERFLLQSHEFIDTVFDSIEESGLLMLDSSLRVIKTNKTFLQIFQLKQPLEKGCRLSDIHPFWQRADVKQQAVNFLVMHNSGVERIFETETKAGDINEIKLQAKLIEGVPDKERKLLIMLKMYPQPVK